MQKDNIFLPSVIKDNPIYSGYIGNVLLDLNGRMDLSIDGSVEHIPCERLCYYGPECEPTRLAQSKEVLKMWHKIYDNGLKFDITFIDSSEPEFYAEHFVEVYNEMKFTSSWMFHFNINPLPYMRRVGGEKSGILLPWKFMLGGMALNLGYDVIIHSNAKYSPYIDYPWKEVIDKFIDDKLDLLITPSRYGVKGFNHNCMLCKPEFWIFLSRTWYYHPERLNADTLDLWEALNALGLVNTDNENEPYKFVNKSRMKLWLDSPWPWYHKTKTVDYEETEDGYKIIRNRG